MNNPLVSILMPAKNVEKYIKECIESILKQDYTNWELLVVDDFSDDNTLSIIKKYASQENRVKVFENKKHGIIEALRLAYVNSMGEYITRMDADDIMSYNKISIMLQNLLDKGEGNISLGLVKYFCEEKIGEGFKKYETWLNKLSAKGTNFTEIYKECVIPSPCWMLNRVDLDRVGAFNSDLYPEDYDLAFRLKNGNIKCLPSNQVIHYWRDYKTRTSRTHQHYADSSFIDIKVFYFLRLNYQTNKNLVLWGAGSKGKRVAQLLLENKIHFYWICDNPKKIGKDIYNQKLLAFEVIDKFENYQSIITVAAPKAQNQIQEYFNIRNKKSMEDYFFFC